MKKLLFWNFVIIIVFFMGKYFSLYSLATMLVAMNISYLTRGEK